VVKMSSPVSTAPAQNSTCHVPPSSNPLNELMKPVQLAEGRCYLSCLVNVSCCTWLLDQFWENLLAYPNQCMHI